MNSDEKKSLASAYRSMMQTPAWKDLEIFANTERDASIRSIDVKNACDLNINTVCEQSGIRKGISRIIQHAQQRSEGV
jgi:hypothetical protein